MIDTLRNLVENLINGNDEINTYNYLCKIFEENAMYEEQCACIEKLWNRTQEHELLKKIGDILSSKLKDTQRAFEAYNKYLQFTQSEFYKNYVACVKQTNFEDYLKEYPQIDFSNEIVQLSDKYTVIISILLFLLRNKEYSTLVEFNSKYLFKLEQKINQNIHENRENFEYLKEINDINIYFSEKLSKVTHHNDINNLAIRFNPQNIAAYINILDDLITYEKYEQCLEFYNNRFSRIFNYKQVNNISDVCFALSEYYREQLDFYKTLVCQKKAVELSLKKD